MKEEDRADVLDTVIDKYKVRLQQINQWEKRLNSDKVIQRNHEKELEKIRIQYKYLVKYNNLLGSPNISLSLLIQS